ncbi:MAG: hypothetical protein LUQ65_01580 [Candidatus Helarchaeota archaeon]|nr:hypothetical protein [Candidatus Helarchaeota archaeon]
MMNKLQLKTDDPQIIEWLNKLTDRECSFLRYAYLRSIDYQVDWTDERKLLTLAITLKFCNPCPSNYECCAFCPMMRPCIPAVKPQYCSLYFCPKVFWQIPREQRIILYGEKWNELIEGDFKGRNCYG